MINYRSINETGGSFEIEIKGSRFIGHIQRAFNEDEAKAFIEQIKKDHWKATHNCSAFQIGDNHDIQRASDDGEPSGTAGVPMLEVLKQNDLHNVVVVVTRYFGGTKLGSGGLIRAYSSAVSEVMHHVGLVERQIQIPLKLTIDYATAGNVEHWINTSSYTLLDTIYLEHVTFELGIPQEDLEKVQNELINLTSDNIHFETEDPRYVDVPIPSK